MTRDEAMGRPVVAAALSSDAMLAALTDAVDAPTGMGTRERRDLAAWWAMDVLCSSTWRPCSRRATHAIVSPCGCSAPLCAEHVAATKANVARLVSEGRTARCPSCGDVASDLHLVTWRPL